MASLHQILQVRQRFADPQDTLKELAPDYLKVEQGEVGPPLLFELADGGNQAFTLIQGFDLDRSGLRVLLDGRSVGTINRATNSGWSTLLLPLPDLASGMHRLQFAPGDTPDSSLISTALIQWIVDTTVTPEPFPEDAETVVLRGWVNLDVQRRLDGEPDGDTIWLLDGEVVEDLNGVGAAVLADTEINKERQDSALGAVRRLKIRFQGIDAPELHAANSKQNYGFLSLAKLEEIGGMRFLGRREALAVHLRCVVFQRNGRSTILDPNGRVLGYVFLDDLDVNLEMVRLGYAFPFLYDSIAERMRDRLRTDAEAASTAEAGVWRDYTTSPVDPLPEGDLPIDDSGPLNFPTYFRRWAKYRNEGGQPGPAFVAWLRVGRDDPNNRNAQDKRLAFPIGTAQWFSDLIDPTTNRLLVKPWEIVFKEN